MATIDDLKIHYLSKSYNVDPLVYHQHNQVEQLKSELDRKKMLFSKNCMKLSNVVGQGR